MISMFDVLDELDTKKGFGRHRHEVQGFALLLDLLNQMWKDDLIEKPIEHKVAGQIDFVLVHGLRPKGEIKLAELKQP
jgi:hypothetical protein